MYYIFFEYESQYKWLVSGGAVAGIALGAKLFMMGSGLNV